MKKLISTVLLLCLVFLLAACSNTAPSVDLLEYYDKDISSLEVVASDLEEKFNLDGTGAFQTAEENTHILTENSIIKAISISEGSPYNIAGIKYGDDLSDAEDLFEDLGFTFSDEEIEYSGNGEYEIVIGTSSSDYPNTTLILKSQTSPNEDKIMTIELYENNFASLMESLEP